MRRRASVWIGVLAALSVDVACGARSGLLGGETARDEPAGAGGGSAGLAGTAGTAGAGSFAGTSGSLGTSGAGGSLGGASGHAGSAGDSGSAGLRDAGLDSGARDAAADAPLDAARDAGRDAALDAPFDAAPDVALDAPLDVALDAPLDVALDAPLDAPSDAALPSCGDAGGQEIFVITLEQRLWAYDPSASAFRLVGAVSCPSASGAAPFSMGVGPDGFALSVYSSGELFRVDTRSGACASTSFVSGQDGFVVFGMAFAPNSATDARERLYVAQQERGANPPPSRGLGAIDPTTFAFSFIGPFSLLQTPGLELASSADGRLFAYSLPTRAPAGTLLELDKATGNVLSGQPLPISTQNALAFTHYQGLFYFFTTPVGTPTTVVTRYDPAAQTLEPAGTLPDRVVGAGLVCPTL